MPAIAGLREVLGIGAKTGVPRNFVNTFCGTSLTDQNPMTALMSKMGRSEKLVTLKFSWWEELLTCTRFTSDATGASATSTNYRFDGGGLALVPGDLLQDLKADSIVYDNEIVEVSSVTRAISIVVRRGQCAYRRLPE